MTETFVQVLDNNEVVIVEGPTPAPSIIEVGLQGPAGVSGSTTFVGLTDTPSSYTGQAGRVAMVNVTETGLTFATVGGTGTVTSVGLSLPAQFSVTNSPITTAGTLVVDWQQQDTNSFLAGPISGGPAAPTFRALVDADIPPSIVRSSRQVNTSGGVIGGGDLSADLSLSLTGQALAIHNLATNGFVVRSAPGAFEARSFQAGANIAITNNDGVAGDPTISVTGLATVATSGSASDLIAGTLPIGRGGTGATTAAGARTNLSVPPTTRVINTTNGLTGGGDLSTDRTLSLTGQALAIHNLSSNGIVARTGAGTFVTRSITAGANISVINSDGVSGNPQIAVTGLAAVATSGSASDITSGSLALARIAQGGASTGDVLKWNGTQWAPAVDQTGGGGSSTFLELTDTPSSYSGQANKAIRVNAAETGLEFFAIGGGGTVTSVDVSGGTTGLTTSGGPITTAGTITLGGTLAVANGGTGATTAAGARTNLGVPPTTRAINTTNGITGGGDLSTDRTLGLTGQALALHNLATNGLIARTGTNTVAARSIVAGANISVTNGDGVSGNPTISVTGLAAVATSGSASDLTTGTLAIARGGTGATTAADARANLGTNDASNITTGSLALARLAQDGATTGQVLKWDGTQWAPGTDNTGSGSDTFLQLTDTPSSYSGQANKFVRVNAAETALEFVSGGGGGGASTFIDLTDTPSSYTASAYPRANAAGNALIWRSAADVRNDLGLTLGQSDRIEIFSDFTTFNSVMPFNAWASGTGASINANLNIAPIAADRVFGVIEQATGTTTAGFARVVWGPTNPAAFAHVVLNDGRAKRLIARVLLNNLPDGTNDYNVRIGFVASYDTTTNIVRIVGGSGYTPQNTWILQCRRQNTETTLAASSGWVASTWYQLELHIPASGGSVEFRINGATIGTVSTNVPTDQTTGYTFLSDITKASGTTSRSMFVDYLGLIVEGSR